MSKLVLNEKGEVSTYQMAEPLRQLVMLAAADSVNDKDIAVWSFEELVRFNEVRLKMGMLSGEDLHSLVYQICATATQWRMDVTNKKSEQAKVEAA